jgi:histidinol-phosphate aminotransferase
MTLNRRNLLKQLGAGVAANSLLAPPRAATETGDSAQAHDIVNTPAINVPRPAGPIRLDHNENAYGASEKAVIAMRQSASQINRYDAANALQNSIAALDAKTREGAYPLKPEQVVMGCGSSDVLRMAALAFLGTGKTLIQATPTCELMSFFAKQTGATIAELPLRKDFSHDLPAMLERASGGESGLLYVCNPNSPTGTLTTRRDLEGFLLKVPSSFHVLIDEAYHHYAGGSGAYASFVDRPSQNPRVLVTRTFSAAYGLAGARVGYAIASEESAAVLAKERMPFAVNSIGITAASAALTDHQHLERCVKRNFDDRQEFLNQVNARMLRALDSHANFVCLNVMRPASEISEHYAKNNFVLAPLIPAMPNYLRISLGTPEQMHEFWRVWDLLGSHPMSM